MRYLGGKTRLAKKIVASIACEIPHDTRIWEPFCGGASITCELVRAGYRVIASDLNLPLINMYLALQKGWVPPEAVSKEDWDAAKTLPDTDPLKAFCGFGCSFGGEWFEAYAKPYLHKNGRTQRHDQDARKALLRDAQHMSKVEFRCADFLTAPLSAKVGLIYADPPYDTSVRQSRRRWRRAVDSERFSSDAFWARCKEWVDSGVRVFVSEFSECPLLHRVVWQENRKLRFHTTARSVVETLYEILPEGQPPPRSESLFGLLEALDEATLQDRPCSGGETS